MNKNLIHDKIKSLLSFSLGSFCLLTYYLTQRLKYINLQFCLPFCMGVNDGISHLWDNTENRVLSRIFEP
jgi:hypothetical protein